MKLDLVFQNIINKISFMLYHQDSIIKACAYKILKACIINEDSLYVLIQNKILIYLIISLSIDLSTDLEKTYAIKLIHKFLVIKNGCNYLSIGVIKSLIHLLDEDLFIISNDLKALIVEVLLEISVLNPPLVYHSNGFNLLIKQLVNNSNIVISINCVLIIINLLNIDEFKTTFFRNGYNLNNLISIFDLESLTEPSKSKVIRFQKVSFLVTVFLKNWNGLLCTSLNDFQILEDLINNLSDHDDWRRKEYILDILLDVLNIKSLPWLRTSVIGEFLLKFNPGAKFLFNQHDVVDSNSNFLGDFEDEMNNDIINHYVNHYVGLVCFVLVKLNIVDLLQQNIHDPHLNDKVVLLLSNVFRFLKLYLPPEFYINLSHKIDLDSLIKISNHTLNSGQIDSNIFKGLKQLNTWGAPKYSDVDDNEFKSLINATKVLTIKEYNSWEWLLIYQLIQGPLKQERRVAELLEKQPKFFKRIISFYRPFKFRFCGLPLSSTKNYKRIIQVGVAMFELLVSTQTGLRYLYKNKIMIQSAEILAQIDPYSGIKAKNAVLKEHNLIHTVNFGYIKFIGKLTETEKGIKILSYWQMFQLLDNIIESSKLGSSNNYFILNLFKSVDFSKQQTINLLSKCLNVCNTSLKLKLVDHLPYLNLDKRTETKLIINNLYQKSIVKPLVDIIYNNYLDQNKDQDYLKLVLSFNPPISIFQKYTKGMTILNQFLLIPKGFSYLSNFSYINNNLIAWLHDKKQFKILKYYESKLNEKLFPYFKFNNRISYNFFLKHLLDTKEGMSYFQNHEASETFIETIMSDIETALGRFQSQKDDDIETLMTDHEMMHLKQNLWILGEINSSQQGMQLLPFEFFDNLIDFYSKCNNWNLKSLLFYQIGKLALNNEGIEMLDDKKWTVSYNKFNKYLNFGYPRNLSLGYFKTETKFDVNFDKFHKYQMYNMDDLTEEESVIIELIFKFPSNLLKLDKQPIKELLFLKKNYSSLFNLDFFLKIIKFIDNSNLNFKKRNFIFGLFIDDTNLLELLIKRKK